MCYCVCLKSASVICQARKINTHTHTHTQAEGKPEEKAVKKYYGRTKDQGPSRLLVKVCALRPASCDKVQILLIIRAFVRFALCFQMFFQLAVGKTFFFALPT